MIHVAIIGAYGSAGVAVADELLERAPGAVRLTLIDDGDPGGGLCILRGCMPSKDVLSAAQHRYQARHDDRLEGTPTVDPDSVVAQKDAHVDGFAEHRRTHVHELAERENVTFHHGTARFVDDRRLVVDGSGDETRRPIEPDYVVIATGSTVNEPDLPGIDAVEYLTSADVLDATDFPESGIVMGFGYIGLELAPYLTEVGGVDLTVIEHDDRPLDELPPAYGETVLELYRDQFDVDVWTNTDERRLEPTDDGGVRLHVDRDGEPSQLEAEALYLFTGRRPAFDGLGLEETTLDPPIDGDGSQWIDAGWVDTTLQTPDDEGVFVVGDANGRELLLHVAKEEGFTAARNILAHRAGRELERYTNVPHHVTFSGLGVYPFARIGHTPATVAESDMDAIVVTRAASADGVFKTKTHPEGRATLVVNAADGSVLGYQGLHLHADVMAKTMQLAVEMKLDVRNLPDRAYHPTTPEILDGLIRDASAELARREGDVDHAAESAEETP